MKNKEKNNKTIFNDSKIYISYEKYYNQKMIVHKKYMLFFIIFNLFFLISILFSFVLKISNFNNSNKCKIFIITDFYIYLLIIIVWLIIYMKNWIWNINNNNKKIKITILNRFYKILLTFILELFIIYFLFSLILKSCKFNLKLFEFCLLGMKSVQFLIQFVFQMVYNEDFYKNLKNLIKKNNENNKDNKDIINTNSTMNLNSMDTNKNCDNSVYSYQNSKRFSNNIKDISSINGNNISCTHDKTYYNSFIKKLTKK